MKNESPEQNSSVPNSNQNQNPQNQNQQKGTTAPQVNPDKTEKDTDADVTKMPNPDKISADKTTTGQNQQTTPGQTGQTSNVNNRTTNAAPKNPVNQSETPQKETTPNTPGTHSGQQPTGQNQNPITQDTHPNQAGGRQVPGSANKDTNSKGNE